MGAMFTLVGRLVLNALSIYLAAYLVEGMSVDGLKGALISAVVFGLTNFFIRPVILLLTLPLNILTLGLFTLVVNGLTLWITAALIQSLDVKGLVPAILGALLISLFNWVFGVSENRRSKKED